MIALLKATLLSVSLHGVVIALAFALARGFDDPARPVIVDFTVIATAESSPGLPGATSEAPARTTAPKPLATRKKARRMAHTAPKPDTSPVPAMEQPAADAVPSFAGNKPVAPAATDDTAKPEPSVRADGTTNNAKNADSDASTPDSEAAKRYLKEHFAYIRDLIRRNISYPPLALYRGWHGEVLVSFIIDRNGRASAKKIIRSSGHSELDNNVLSTIEAVSPFPQPPVKAELRIPIIYSLE